MCIRDRLREIYDHFTESVRDLGNKAKGHAGSKKLGNSFMHWIGGGHIRTDRDRLCEEFLEQVQGFLGEFDTGLQGLAPEEAAALCGQVADIMLDPIPPKSNATTDLMKRAMRSQFKPFLKMCIRDRISAARHHVHQSAVLRFVLAAANLLAVDPGVARFDAALRLGGDKYLWIIPLLLHLFRFLSGHLLSRPMIFCKLYHKPRPASTEIVGLRKCDPNPRK